MEDKRLEVPTPLRQLDGIAQFQKPAFNIGLYFFCSGDEVVYVGKSVGLLARISGQLDGCMEFDRIYLLQCADEVLDAAESLMIHVLRPKYNGQRKNQRKETAFNEMYAPLTMKQLLKFVCAEAA